MVDKIKGQQYYDAFIRDFFFGKCGSHLLVS